MLAYDSETWPIRRAMPVPRMVCGQFANSLEPGSGVVLLREGALDKLERSLKGGAVIVGHNLPYDLAVAAQERWRLLELIFEAITEGRLIDTLNREKLIDIAKGKYFPNRKGYYSLEQCAKRRKVRGASGVDKKRDAEIRTSYWRMDGKPVNEWPDDYYRYAQADPELTLALAVASCNAHPVGKLPGENTNFEAMFCLHLMSCWGLKPDPVHTKALHAQVLERIDKAKTAAIEAGFLVPNPKNKSGYSAKKKIIEQVLVSWSEETGHELKRTDPSKTHPQGQISQSAEQLLELHVPALDDYIEFKKAEKVLSTYVQPPMEGLRYGRVNPRYNHVLNSHRTSCYGPNIQNQPARDKTVKVRECYVATPGWTFIASDYSTQELRALAQITYHLFGYSAMRDAINQGKDLHIVTALGMPELVRIGISYADASELYSLIDEGDTTGLSADDIRIGELVAKLRQHVKPANFGVPGGMGAAKFVTYAKQYGISITVPEAAQLKEVFMRTFPEMKSYFNYCRRLCTMPVPPKNKGDQPRSIAPIVEMVLTGFLRGRVAYTEVCNGFFQHLSAVISKEALAAVTRECMIDRESALYGSRPCAFIHDEIIIETPMTSVDRIDNARERLQELMEQAMRNRCPDVAVATDARITRRWRKKVGKVKDKQGRMIPCKPDGNGGWESDLPEWLECA